MSKNNPANERIQDMVKSVRETNQRALSDRQAARAAFDLLSLNNVNQPIGVIKEDKRYYHICDDVRAVSNEDIKKYAADIENNIDPTFKHYQKGIPFVAKKYREYVMCLAGGKSATFADYIGDMLFFQTYGARNALTFLRERGRLPIKYKEKVI